MSPDSDRAFPASAALALAALAVLTLIAADLRVTGLEQPGLWLDEILGVFRAQSSPFTTSWTPGTDPQHGPLHHTILWVMDKVHPTDGGYRFPFALLGVLTVPLLFVVARDLAGTAAAVLAAALFAVAPLHVYLSRECRPYGFMVLLQVLSMACASRQLAGGPSRAWKATFLASNVLLAFLSSQGIWYALVGLSAYACALLGAGREPWRDTVRTLVVNAIVSAALFVALHGYLLLHSPDAVGTPPITAEFVARMFNGMVTGLQEFLPMTADGRYAAVAGVLGLGVLAWWRPRAAGVYVAALLSGIVLPFVLLKLADHGLRTRFMLAGTAPFALLVGSAVGVLLDRLASLVPAAPTSRGVATTTLACLMAWPVTEHFRPLIERANSYKPDWKRVVRVLKDRAHAGDLVVTSNDWARVNLLYHLPRVGLRLEMVSAGESVEKAEQALAGRRLAFLVTGGWHATGDILRWQEQFPEVLALRTERVRVNFWPDQLALLTQRPSMREVERDERMLRDQMAGTLVPGLNSGAYLLEGWGELAPAPGGEYRRVSGRARIYVPLSSAPPRSLRVRAMPAPGTSPGTLVITVNGTTAWSGPLPAEPIDATLPAAAWRLGGNVLELSFAATEPGRADPVPARADVNAVVLTW